MTSDRPMRWLSIYHGPDFYFDGPQVLRMAFMLRLDLLDNFRDIGRLIPCVFEIVVRYGQTYEARMDERLDWVLRINCRCDASEIARRLAGGDE